MPDTNRSASQTVGAIYEGDGNWVLEQGCGHGLGQTSTIPPGFLPPSTICNMDYPFDSQHTFTHCCYKVSVSEYRCYCLNEDTTADQITSTYACNFRGLYINFLQLAIYKLYQDRPIGQWSNDHHNEHHNEHNNEQHNEQYGEYYDVHRKEHHNEHYDDHNDETINHNYNNYYCDGNQHDHHRTNDNHHGTFTTSTITPPTTSKASIMPSSTRAEPTTTSTTPTTIAMPTIVVTSTTAATSTATLTPDTPETLPEAPEYQVRDADSAKAPTYVRYSLHTNGTTKVPGCITPALSIGISVGTTLFVVAVIALTHWCYKKS
ncbi:myelin gene regulatory factor-like A [Paramacrobiotus metropolitanus]|uniref:myelin gene regulatory factor-like A n=1 Tax=Paramacrobiotus metropolitanus TaxID=2943436 RepID=UPI00244620FC|nr:myelin gene regulatory factor-like A [Paramacrobiotus metropolitanus]